jgi:hypothetical protein
MAGDMALEQLADQYELEEQGVEGTQFSNVSKTNLVLQLQDAIQQRQIVFPYIYILVNQLIYYKWDDKKIETDAVFGLALAIEQAKRVMGDAFERLASPDIPLYVVQRDPLGGIVLPDIDETIEINKFLVW